MTESSQPTPTPTPANQNEPAPQPKVDLATLPADQLKKVLENPELFNLPRIKELVTDSSDLKKLKQSQATAAEEQLKEQKKFEELAAIKSKESDGLREQLKTSNIDRALTIKLAAAGAVDVDGGLKLIDRSKIEIDENGSLKGVDEALAALKTDKSYLFTASNTPPAKVGGPTNPANGDENGAPAKFKSSQITPSFYKENEKAILEAYAAGLVEDDGSPQY